MKKLSTLASNTGNIMGALDTFHTPTAKDGICNHCGLYNSELDNDGHCLYDQHESGGGDCWHTRVVKLIEQGKARMLPSGTFLMLPGLED